MRVDDTNNYKRDNPVSMTRTIQNTEPSHISNYQLISIIHLMHVCSSQHDNIYCSVHLIKDDFILKFLQKKRLDESTVGRMVGPRGLG
jgi:hypothetical protein